MNKEQETEYRREAVSDFSCCLLYAVFCLLCFIPHPFALIPWRSPLLFGLRIGYTRAKVHLLSV
jgi:hypothetical protein